MMSASAWQNQSGGKNNARGDSLSVKPPRGDSMNSMNSMNRLNYVHISLVIIGNRVVAYGLNNLKYHSEEMAWCEYWKYVRQNGYYFEFKQRHSKNRVIIINLAINRHFMVRNSRPCLKCSNLIYRNKKHIDAVMWTDTSTSIDQSNAELIIHGAKPSSANRKY